MASAQAENFVQYLYTQFYGRQADESGLTYWADQLDAGTLSATQVVESFFQANEFMSIVAPVARLYNAAFGRIFDAEGLDFWTGAYRFEQSQGLSAEQALDEIAQEFIDSAEFQNRYGSGLTDQQYVEQLYQNVLNRPGEPDGVNFWINSLQGGTSRADVLTQFSESPENEAASSSDIQTSLLYFGLLERAPTQTELDSAAGQPLNTAIDALLQSDEYENSDAPPVPDGDGSQPGQTFALTDEIDVITGTAGDDTIVGDSDNLSASDDLQGGEGTDRLNLTLDRNESEAPQLSGIEQLFVRDVESGSSAVDLSAASGVSEIWNDRSSQPVQVINADTLAAVGLNRVQQSSSTTTVQFENDVNLSTVTLLVTDAEQAGTVDIGTEGGQYFQTYAITASGMNSLQGLTTGSGTRTLQIDGSGFLHIDDSVGHVTLLDASNNSGGVGLESGVAGVDFIGGSGADSFELTRGTIGNDIAVTLNGGDDILRLTGLQQFNQLGGGASFTGNGGSDILNLVNGNVLTGTTGAQFSGFEALDVADGQNSYDLSHLADTNTLDRVLVSGNLASATTIVDAPEAAALALSTSMSHTLTYNQENAGAGSPNDTLTVMVQHENDLSGLAVDINDIETVAISVMSSEENVTHTFASLGADEALSVNVTASSAEIVIQDLEADSLVLFDAFDSSMEVDVTVGSDTFSGSGVGFLLGAAADQLNLTGADTGAASSNDLDFRIVGNGGGDQVTLASAAAGVDRLEYTFQSDSTATGYDQIANFSAAAGNPQDQIDLSAFDFSANAAGALIYKGTSSDISLNASDDIEVAAAAQANFFNDFGVDRAVATWTQSGDIYVFVDSDQNGDYSATGDMVIKLSGVTETDLDTGNFIF